MRAGQPSTPAHLTVSHAAAWASKSTLLCLKPTPCANGCLATSFNTIHIYTLVAVRWCQIVSIVCPLFQRSPEHLEFKDNLLADGDSGSWGSFCFGTTSQLQTGVLSHVHGLLGKALLCTGTSNGSNDPSLSCFASSGIKWVARGSQNVRCLCLKRAAENM